MATRVRPARGDPRYLLRARKVVVGVLALRGVQLLLEVLNAILSGQPLLFARPTAGSQTGEYQEDRRETRHHMIVPRFSARGRAVGEG